MSIPHSSNPFPWRTSIGCAHPPPEDPRARRPPRITLVSLRRPQQFFSAGRIDGLLRHRQRHGPLGFPPFLSSSLRTHALPHVLRSSGQNSSKPSGTLALLHPRTHRPPRAHLCRQSHSLDRP